MNVPSVLWRCWLGGRKGIRPVKNWVVGYWHGYLSGARCRLACGPADATATHCLLLHLNPDWFCLLVPAHLGSPGQRAVKRVCVCVPGPCKFRKWPPWLSRRCEIPEFCSAPISAGLCHHIAGKTMRNCYCDIALNNHTDIFLKELIRFHLNNVINLSHLTPHMVLC